MRHLWGGLAGTKCGINYGEGMDISTTETDCPECAPCPRPPVIHAPGKESATLCGRSELRGDEEIHMNARRYTCHECNRLTVGQRYAQEQRADRIAFLERKLAVTKADLLMKFEDEDDHGVVDAAMDCRDIRNELKGLRWQG